MAELRVKSKLGCLFLSPKVIYVGFVVIVKNKEF